MRTILILLWTSALLVPGLRAQEALAACIWIYGTTPEGEAHRTSGHSIHFRQFTNHLWHIPWEEQAEAFRERAKQGGFQAESNYAVALMHLGESARALKILERLGKEHPDEYVVAANLGTAYELNGDNEKALAWIQRGMELNPDSHFGTEWLHLKILEAKIAMASDPDWLEEHSVLGLSFGTAPKPVLPGPWQDKAERERVIEALEYQLGERMQFVKPPDPLVADLLFDLANLVAFDQTLEASRPFYEFAASYGPWRAELIALRQEFIRGQIRRAAPRRWIALQWERNPGVLLFGGVSAILLALFTGLKLNQYRKRLRGF